MLLPDRGDTILFVDGEEAVTAGSRCDCIVVLRRDGRLEVYAVELKSLSKATGGSLVDGALKPDKLRGKWENCLKWALGLLSSFNSARHGGRVEAHAVLAVPGEALGRIARLMTHQSRRLRYRPQVAGAVHGWLAPCNSTLTTRAYKLF